MAPRSKQFLICLSLVAATTVCQAQAFGRFGYSEVPSIPCLSVDKTGFKAKQDAADQLRFNAPSKTWKPALVSSAGATYLLDGSVWSPQKVRFDLWAPGISLYFPSGMKLHVRSTAAPYLTWGEGSVTNGVPTPEARWLSLSFRDNQPPIAFGFPQDPASLTITGKPGAWIVSSKYDFKGWVRVGCPIGIKPLAANSAGALGRLARIMTEQASIWGQMPPTLQKLDVTSDLGSVQGTWRFDKPGAVLPIGAQFAQMGGYPIKIDSEVRRTEITDVNGPADVATTNEISVRFPIRRIPAGRCLTVGTALPQPIGTVSPQDLPGIVELALESLTAGRDLLTRKSGEDTLAEFLSQATYIEEPITRQKLPFDGLGNDADLTAAAALLMQAISTTAKPASEANSLLTSIAWVQDASTWLPAVKDAEKARRAAALAALAGALCPEPERRLTAAMFQAGLAAERGQSIWQRRTGFSKTDKELLEPVVGIRRGIFSLTWPTAENILFASNLLGSLRLFSDAPVLLTKRENQWLIQWPTVEAKPATILLAGAYPVEVEPLRNLIKFDTANVLGLLEMRYTPELAGTCEVAVKFPNWAKEPPDAVPVPRYSEPKIGPNPR